MMAWLYLDVAYWSLSSYDDQSFFQLHAAHEGTVRTKLWAKQIVYWPGIDNDIDNIILTCKPSQDSITSHLLEPMVSKQRPSCSFQQITIDFCSCDGPHFLIVVDCCNDWPEIIYMGKNTIASHLTSAFLGIFSRYGAPDVAGPTRNCSLHLGYSRPFPMSGDSSMSPLPLLTHKVMVKPSLQLNLWRRSSRCPGPDIDWTRAS